MNSYKANFGLAIAACGVAALLASPPASTHSKAGNSVARNELLTSCADLEMNYENHRSVVQSEERTISKAEAATLTIQAEANGGLQVEGWDKQDYGVTLCKAADAEFDAASVLANIHITFQNGELGVSGPALHNHWNSYLLVRSPKSSSIDLRVNNGPLRLSNVHGTVKIRTRNGPVSVTDCSGDFDLVAQNGPITLSGNGGKLRIDSQNGPLTLALSGQSWDGTGIEAHAGNGPLTVEIPSGYQSGVLVESTGHSPFECRASVCSEGRRNWAEDRKSIEFGSGPARIHLSTGNGPVSVR